MRGDFTRLPPERRSQVPLSGLGAPKRPVEPERPSVFERVIGWRRSVDRWPTWGSEGLPPTIVLAAPKCFRDVVLRGRKRRCKAWCKTRNQKADGASLEVLVPFGVSELGQSLCIGLPDRYRPLSRFLTFSAVSSCPSLATLFRVASAHRILAFRAFPAQPAVASFDARCSFVVTSSSGENGFPRSAHRPNRPSPALTGGLIASSRHEPSAHLDARQNIITVANGRSQTVRCERLRRLSRVVAQRLFARFSGVAPVKRSDFRLAWDANFRALLRLSIRSRDARR